MTDDVILVGFGGHGKSVADCIERSGIYNIIGYTDLKKTSSNYRYLGTDGVLEKYLEIGYNKLVLGVGYIGENTLRENLYYKYKEIGFEFPVIIDPSAVVSDHSVINEGAFIGKNAIVNAETSIGKMAIINNGAIIEHDCVIGDFTHVSVGTVICGNVLIDNSSFIGANATIIQNIRIGSFVKVGAGAVVLNNVNNNIKVVGNPACTK